MEALQQPSPYLHPSEEAALPPLTSLASPSPNSLSLPASVATQRLVLILIVAWRPRPSPFALQGARRSSTLVTLPTVIERGHAYRRLHTFCPNLLRGRGGARFHGRIVASRSGERTGLWQRGFIASRVEVPPPWIHLLLASATGDAPAHTTSTPGPPRVAAPSPDPPHPPPRRHPARHHRRADPRHPPPRPRTGRLPRRDRPPSHARRAGGPRHRPAGH